MKQAIWFVTIGFVVLLSAQQTTRPIEGLREKPQRYIALTHVMLVPEPGSLIDDATVIIRDGIIEAVGKKIPIPKGATEYNCKGMWCYAGFIESYALERDTMWRDDDLPRTPPVHQARHWNEAVHPEMRIVERLSPNQAKLELYRKLGFCVLHVGIGDGIFRGQSALISAREGSLSDITIAEPIAQLVSFRKGSSRTPYPSSLMGSIALIRQILLDAQWYSNAHRAYSANKLLEQPEVNTALEALAKHIAQRRLFVFEAEDEHDILRADAIAREHDLDVVFVGTGQEYRRLPSLVKAAPRMIIPLNFPDVPDVTSYERAVDVSFEELLHWDAAPENPFRCDSAGLWFCITSYHLEDRSTFWSRLRKAIQYGLSPERALASLTTRPAELLGVSRQLGKVRPGYCAHLVLANGDLFTTEAEIRIVYIDGRQYTITTPQPDIRGTWRIVLGRDTMQMLIEGTVNTPAVTFKQVNTKVRASANRLESGSLSIIMQADSLGLGSGILRLSCRPDTLGYIEGLAVLPNGEHARWHAIRVSPYRDTSANTLQRKRSLGVMIYPFGPFGLEKQPPQHSVLFKGATVWTCAASGVLDSTDVLISQGKIVAVGRNLMGGDTIIEAHGKHLTPGIIDEHSHIAISRGVNEGTHAITAEVEIGRVLDPDDINIYRQLAGGVTTSHLLHGSANPIGGQLQLIKLRWGQDAEGLKFQGAPPTIKFALGENVKQSNWGDRYTTRYPQTRMGVEEIMRDAFRSALEYETARKEALGRGLPFRRDLQLETLGEILRSQRFIHCHSYVQSEILMLMRLAEEFGFKVQTFTHVLEGYKVAREMKEHGATASSFSDWWAYKFEVYDAIPQNPAILAEQGVITSVNSDDAEMARRLAHEAAKSVKYGGMDHIGALMLCTINPAIQLKIDRWVGSIEAGKDADIVLWNGHPLSSYSIVEQTYVDGRCYFDRRRDEQLQARDRELRRILEQRALVAIERGDRLSEQPSLRRQRLYHCDDVDDEVAGW